MVLTVERYYFFINDFNLNFNLDVNFNVRVIFYFNIYKVVLMKININHYDLGIVNEDVVFV